MTFCSFQKGTRCNTVPQVKKKRESYDDTLRKKIFYTALISGKSECNNTLMLKRNTSKGKRNETLFFAQ